MAIRARGASVTGGPDARSPAMTDEERAASLIAFHLQSGDVPMVEECIAGFGGRRERSIA